MGLLNWILDLFYPPRCAVCHGLLHPGFPAVCPACESTLPRTYDGGLRTGTCFSVCVSPLFYRDAVRDAVIDLKFHGKTSGIPQFGIWMADCVRDNLDGEYDLVTWVPVSRKRLRSRGYDQAKLLARALAERLDAPLTKTLVKRVDNPAQSGIADPQARAENVRGVYVSVGPEKIAGKRILLVDDVITTGSTLEAAASALRHAGAASVVCCTLACAASLERDPVV